jgi:transcriptional regulator with XRE-family HTH domain
MGTRARQRPERLAEKLVAIRTALGVSQSEMIRRLGAEEVVTQNILSNYELGKREPALLILLQYARVAGVPMEVLVDDELSLPEHLPGPTDHQELRRQFAPRRR